MEEFKLVVGGIWGNGCEISAKQSGNFNTNSNFEVDKSRISFRLPGHCAEFFYPQKSTKLGLKPLVGFVVG